MPRRSRRRRGQRDGRPDLRQHRGLVLRVGQRVAGAVGAIGRLRADVAQRLQPLEVLARHARGRLRLRAGQQADRAPARAAVTACGRSAARLRVSPRVCLEVVELRAGRLDEAVARVGEGVRARSSRSDSGRRTPRRRSPVPAAGPPRPRAAARSERPRRPPARGAPARSRMRRHEVDVLHRVRTRGARRPRPPGSFTIERHADRRVVEEQPVLLLAVVAEPFAVIRQEDDRRARSYSPRCFSHGDQLADDLVGAGDLAVVGVRTRANRSGGRVRRVRLVDVEEEEERGDAEPSHPRCGHGQRVARRSRCTWPIGMSGAAGGSSPS